MIKCCLQVGTYDPVINSHGEKLLALNIERIQHHLAQGIELEQKAAELLGKQLAKLIN